MKGFTTFYDEMSYEEAAEAFKKTEIAIIPLGATHPHGVACPLGTDTFVAHGIAERVGKKGNAIVMPASPYGWNQYHMDFPGCINMPHEHLRDHIYYVAKALHKWGIRKIIFVSPHGGNTPIISDVAYRLRYELGMLSMRVTYGIAGQVDPKAAGYGSEGMVDEAAMISYVRPELAHPEKSKAKPPLKNLFKPFESVPDFRKVVFKGGKPDLFMTSKDATDTCEWGNTPQAWDMSNATAELGERIIETAANYIVDLIDAFAQVKIPPTY